MSISRTTGAIALRPYNDHGGWAFMSLITGDQIVRSRWTQLPIPSDVIQRVHDELATTQQQSKIDVDEVFTWMSGDRIFPVATEGASSSNALNQKSEANEDLQKITILLMMRTSKKKKHQTTM